MLLAGLLYLGSGVGLAAWLALRAAIRPRSARQTIPRRDYAWLAGAIAAGGVVAPLLLVFGLVRTSASTASLLLNLESVLTAVIAWLVFRENVDRRVFLGWLAIVAGGSLLSFGQAPHAGGIAGPLFIAGACLGWALDNNLTRRISGGDAVVIACLKGLVAGACNLLIAYALGARLPSPGSITAAGLLGLASYGVSLVLFIVALRNLGTARTGAYFAVAPFFGAALSLWLLAEATTPAFWIAGMLMAIGIWLHLSERHEHSHAHQPMEHDHVHVHDEHHRHAHDPAWDGSEPHSHVHRHERLVHSHPHYPDLHHRHGH